MNKLLLITCAIGMLFSAMAEDIAVFPVQGVNTAKSFSDAFGVLLANKYEKASGLSAVNPLKSGKVMGPDS